jgi:SHS2 domain-containing protein
MPYKIIRQADVITVETEAITIEGLFALCCHAWRDTFVECDDFSSTDLEQLFYQAGTYEELLAQLLNDLYILLVDHKWIFNSVEKLVLVEDESGLKINIDILGSIVQPEDLHFKEQTTNISAGQINIDLADENVFAKFIFAI